MHVAAALFAWLDEMAGFVGVELPMSFSGEELKIVDGIIERVPVLVVKFMACWNRAVDFLPHRPMKATLFSVNSADVILSVV